jgi:tetratricopeptide (TPR) repeat protein
MPDSPVKLTATQPLNLPKQQVNTQVQKLCQQGGDAALSGDHDRAIGSYTQAIALAPDCVSAYCARGESLLALKDYPRAAADYTTALKLSPAHAIATGGLAQVYYAQQDYPAALAACNRPPAKVSGDLLF